MTTRSALIPLLLFAAISCRTSRFQEVAETENEPPNAFSDFEKRVGTFPYQMPDAARDRIKTGFDKLLVGMTMAEVKSTLGNPDLISTEDRARLKYDSAEIHYKSRIKTGSSFMYYVSRRDAVYGHKDDETVQVDFGVDGKLAWALLDMGDDICVMGRTPMTVERVRESREHDG